MNLIFSAIETLVTAISLIKQSKVAHDERCKILISSLQDTLNGNCVYISHFNFDKYKFEKATYL